MVGVVASGVVAFGMLGAIIGFGGEGGERTDAREVAAASSSAPAAGDVLTASDAASFAEALARAQPGDTIELAAGSYPVLTVENREGITISGPRAAELDGVRFVGARRVTLSGVTVTPSADVRAEIVVEGDSSDVTIEGVLIDGRDERVGAGVVADGTVSGLVVRGSEVTNCGSGQRCIAASRTRGVVVDDNTFHDCLSCDFIRGGSGMTIRGNTFDRAIHGECEALSTSCPHNDHIQITGGGPWVITGNRFGDREGGAASIFIAPGRDNDDNPIHDVRIRSNLFLGEAGRFGVKLVGGRRLSDGLLKRISIVNNTILSGRIGAIVIESGWESRPRGERPVVANNVFGVMGNEALCVRAVLAANVVQDGHSCRGLRESPTALDSAGAPTAASSSLINKADPAYAPSRDFYGNRRAGRPDVGAIEFQGG